MHGAESSIGLIPTKFFITELLLDVPRHVIAIALGAHYRIPLFIHQTQTVISC